MRRILMTAGWSGGNPEVPVASHLRKVARAGPYKAAALDRGRRPRWTVQGGARWTRARRPRAGPCKGALRPVDGLAISLAIGQTLTGGRVTLRRSHASA